MRDGDLQFSNVDDPPQADCPGVFLDWQIDTNQPNGNDINSDEQDCIAFQKTADNANAFQDKACSALYGVLCKATASKDLIKTQ